ncbi:lipid-binding protein [Tamlana sp. I1]|uniref:lipid-binding protein n=1 Tax=Tamlana sp. I1 TaxID=2762061 RepID=UPI00188F3873|nr:lipid-binding protein [Tamlana sp. I1]
MISVSFTSCDEDLEIWDSNTLDYSGTYFYELYNEDMTTKYVEYSHSNQILIYNTANNNVNELWMEDTANIFPLKSKFFLNGSTDDFSSESLDFSELTNNINAVVPPSTKPTGLNQTVNVATDYIRAAVLEGKILKNEATTVSGNPVDSIYTKIVLYSGEVKYTSYEVAEADRVDPDVVEFAWEYDSATYDSTLDEIYVISGHRKTGFAEDDH